jgi:hypothetical protein
MAPTEDGMALARIRTHFPEEVAELEEALIEAGYIVETIRMDEFRIAPADLELTVEKLPVVEAWRHVPNTDVVYVAPGTPESCDIRSYFGAANSREPRLARLLVGMGERYEECSRWAARQRREWSARVHEIRERWTPPREYHNAPVHLEPVAPSNVDHAAEVREPRIDVAIEQALLQQEELRRRQEAEQRELQEQARLAEENRRRAREAAEARALLEEQRKIEAMVRVTEELRERVVVANLPKPHVVERRKPRHLLRTRRERAVFRAGVAAFVLSFGLAFLAAEALHPRSASGAIPQNTRNNVASDSVPFAKPSVAAAPVFDVQDAGVKSAAPGPTFAPTPAVALPSVGNMTSARHVGSDDIFNEVIVRKPHVARPQPSKQKRATIVHYSDLD